jgi:hypothetical protein
LTPLQLRLPIYSILKTLLLAAVAALPAMAGELPISTIYGTPAACEQFAINGAGGVIYGEPVAADDAPILLVRSADVLTHETQCSPDGDTLGSVTFSCQGGDQEWSWAATLSVSGNTLFWKDEDGSLELHPCPVNEQGIM